jgi:hypothetical protein
MKKCEWEGCQNETIRAQYCKYHTKKIWKDANRAQVRKLNNEYKIRRREREQGSVYKELTKVCPYCGKTFTVDNAGKGGNMKLEKIYCRTECLSKSSYLERKNKGYVFNKNRKPTGKPQGRPRKPVEAMVKKPTEWKPRPQPQWKRDEIERMNKIIIAAWRKGDAYERQMIAGLNPEINFTEEGQ